MDVDGFGSKQAYLFEHWCARRPLGPLHRLVNGLARLYGLTDCWEDLLFELRSVRAQDKDDIEDKERDAVVELIHFFKAILLR